ncbi:MAG: T9SS type A sorting domain-containing protein [Crocinitomicaceae bacterium]
MMKFNLSFLLLLSISLTTQAQVVQIPDFNFKNYLLNRPDINTNGDNEIQASEAAAFTDSIICPNMNILSIEGIEAFTNLTFLNVAQNSISSINVSQNTELKSVILPYNDVSVISLGTNSNLEELVVWENQLTSIDVSFNPNLKRLEIPNNNIGSLDLSQNPNLERLVCSGNNVGSLDLSIHTNLQYLECNGCNLSSIDVSNCPLLWGIQCMVNNITQFDFSQNPLLQRASCDFNKMTELDLSMNANVSSVGCFGCSNLITLNVQNGNNTNFTSFQANNSPNLVCVQVDDVAYSVANWMSIDTSSVYNTSCASASLNEQLISLNLYPNPISDRLSIKSSAPIERIRIISMDGKCVMDYVPSDTFMTDLDVSALATGAYSVHVVLSNGEQFVKRVVK